MSLVFPPAGSQPECNEPLECHTAAANVLAPQALAEEAFKDLVQLFKLLADETRMKILYFLRHTDELNVLELCSLLSQRQPSVSHHLALLRVAGLIDMRREGKHNYYRVLPKRFEELIGQMFNGSQGEPPRIRFEEFELRYAPIQHDA